MSHTFEMLVPMKRGGKMPMMVEGDYSSDTDGAGQEFETTDICKVYFKTSRNEKDMSHLVDIEQLRGLFREKFLDYSKGLDEEAQIRAHEDV